MTDTQERAAPDAPPRRPTHWLRGTTAAFALAIVLGGTDLVTGVPSSGGRGFVIAALAVAFLSFALVGADILPSSSSHVAVAAIGVAALTVALLVSWSAVGSLPDPATVKTSHEWILGDTTNG
ncbi:hypothetical protein AB0K00_00930 [Dactylosporangium sp. NPDC049525]|uniref:hypothetical protein n=1 Tax=Dactylosporangium sp. NPDC049525 TaxID=3154730 RepID=UPI0034183BE9